MNRVRQGFFNRQHDAGCRPGGDSADVGGLSKRMIRLGLESD